jgi:hypothetical protein
LEKNKFGDSANTSLEYQWIFEFACKLYEKNKNESTIQIIEKLFRKLK